MMTGSHDTTLSLSSEAATPLERENPHGLLEAHLDGLVNYLTRLTGNRTEAEDLAQESFLRLFRTLQRKGSESMALKPYLYTIATNLARNAERKRRRFALLQPLLRHWQQHRAGALPGDGLETTARQQCLSRALARVPLAFRVPLVLHVIERWPYEQIARLLEVAEGTVKSRINRGKAKLRELLADAETGGDP